MSNALRLTYAAFGAIALSACTLEPEYHRPDAPMSPPSIGSGTAAAVDVGWRDFFPDQQLQQLIALALANNRDLRVAALNVETAEAQYRIRRANLLPTIAASGVEQAERFPASASAAGTSSISHTYEVGVGFTNFELDLFGRIRSLNHAALEEYFGSEEARRTAQIALVAEVARAYLAVLTDQTLTDITRQTLRNQSDSLALTQKMFEGGATTQLALRQAETTVDTARANLAQYTRQLALDRDALQLLVGSTIPDDIDFSAGLDRGASVSDIEIEIPSTVLVQRPDVLVAEHQLQAAYADIGAARAAFFPTISLTGNYGTASSELSGLFKHGSKAWTFVPQISVPIFTGGANSANLKVAKLSRDAAVAHYEKAIQIAFREVADALAARGTLDEQWEAQQALVMASEDAYRLADMRFHGGVENYLSALDAQRSLYGAQQQLQVVRLLRLENRVTFYKVLGGGLRESSAVASVSRRL